MSIGDSGSSDWELIDENREEVDYIGEDEDDQLIVMRRESIHLHSEHLNILDQIQRAASNQEIERIRQADVSESEESDFVRLEHDDDTILMDASGSSSISSNFSFVNRDGVLFMDRESLTESDHALLSDDERCSEEESICLVHRLRNNRHVPNCQLNNSLNFIVMLVCVAFFSFLSGHFIGMHEMAAEKRMEYLNKLSSFVPMAELDRCQLEKSLLVKRLDEVAIPAGKLEDVPRRPLAMRFDTVLFADEWHRYCHREEAPMNGFCLSKPRSTLSCAPQPHIKEHAPPILPSAFIMFNELRTSLANLKKDLVTQNDLKAAIEQVATMLPKQAAPIHDNYSRETVFEYENKTTTETKGFSTSYLVKRWNDLKQKARQVRDTVTKHIGESRGNLTCHWNKLKYEAVFVKEKVKSAFDGAMGLVRNLSLFTPAILQFPQFPAPKAACESRQVFQVPEPERSLAELPVASLLPPPPPMMLSPLLSTSSSSSSSSSSSLMCLPLNRPSSFATMKDWLNWMKQEQTQASTTFRGLVKAVDEFNVDDIDEESKDVRRLVDQLEELSDSPEGKPWVQCQLTWWRGTISGNSVDIATPSCNGFLALWQKQTPNSDWYFRRMADRESRHQWSPSPQWLFQRGMYREQQRSKGDASEWWFQRQQMRSSLRDTNTQH